MMFSFISLGLRVIKCLRKRHMGLVCVEVRFSLSLFFLVLGIAVMLDDNWYFFFFDQALVDWMVLIWIR